MSICSHCNTRLPDGETKCPNCHATVPHANSDSSHENNIQTESASWSTEEDWNEPFDFRRPTQIYTKKEDKYRDALSSAYTFLVTGAAGLLFLLLIATGFLKLDFLFAHNIMLTITSTVMFVVFVLYGIYLLRKSKTLAKEASSENQLSADITKWFHKNVEVDLLEIDVTTEMMEGEKYYKRLDNIRKLILKTYGDLEEGYLEKLAEDLYSSFYN